MKKSNAELHLHVQHQMLRNHVEEACFSPHLSPSPRSVSQNQDMKLIILKLSHWLRWGPMYWSNPHCTEHCQRLWARYCVKLGGLSGSSALQWEEFRERFTKDLSEEVEAQLGYPEDIPQDPRWIFQATSTPYAQLDGIHLAQQLLACFDRACAARPTTGKSDS